MRREIVAAFLGFHIVFGVFFLIHQYTEYVRLVYILQEYEKKLATRYLEKQELLAQKYTLQNQSDVQKYAHDYLQMKPIALTRLKHVSVRG